MLEKGNRRVARLSMLKAGEQLRVSNNTNTNTYTNSTTTNNNNNNAAAADGRDIVRYVHMLS